MNKLPLELVEEILHHLPSSSCPTARLTSRTFNAILSKRIFHVLASFVKDPEVAKRTLTTTARGPARRTRAIWSPHCLVPKGLPITESFLLALWTSLHGESWTPSSEPGSGDDTKERLTISALQAGLKKKVNITAEALRDAMFRYTLYLSYVCRDDRTAPHAWVFDFLLHRNADVATARSCGMEDTKQSPVVMHWEGSSLIDVKE